MTGTDMSGPSPRPKVRPSPDRRELLSLLLRNRGGRPGAAPSLGLQPRPESLPLTPNQQGLWFLDQLHPGRADYSIPGAVLLSGRLDLAALEQSLSEIVRRHESLRSVFSDDGHGLPHQRIEPSRPLRLAVVDLGRLPEDERMAEALRLATIEARTPFDIARGPLFRAQLVRLDSEQHVLVINMHHMVSDGWSMGILTRELTELYDAFSRGRPSPLKAPSIQFSDYVLWQRERMRGTWLDDSLTYWRLQLGKETKTAELPSDRPRPAVSTLRGSHLPVRIAPHIRDGLREIASREHVTLYVALLAAFQVLLYRFGGSTNVVVGATFANRVHPKLETVIGFFANTLPLRTDLSGNPSFRELLARVQETCLDAHAHQEVELAWLVKELQPSRDLDQQPLYRIVFDFLTPDHNPAVYGYGMSRAADETVELRGLTVKGVDVECGVARFDLAVFIWDMRAGLSGTVEYSTDLFDETTIARLFEQYEALLSDLIARPTASIEELVASIQRRDKSLVEKAEQSYLDDVRARLRRVRDRRSGTGPSRSAPSGEGGERV